MSVLFDASESIVALLFTAVAHGSVLAALTWIVAHLFRSAPAGALAMVWTIALLKFAVPIAPGAPFALSNVVSGASPWVAGSNSMAATSTPLVTVAPAVTDWTQWLIVGLAFLWLAGAVLGLSRIALAGRVLREKVGALPLASNELLAAVGSAAARLGVSTIPDVRVDETASSAYLAGWWRPVLVMPALEASASREAILLHELAHVRRRDPAMRAIETIIRGLFFFFPPVTWIGRRIDLLREQACDELAVERSSLTPRRYAGLLLEAATASRRPQALAFGAGRRSQLERRVRAVMARPKRRLPPVVITAILLPWSVVALAGSSSAESDARVELRCATDPALGEQILASYPDADTDGDGVLSKNEVCAHQLRMQRKLLDAVVHRLPTGELLGGDLDGDGLLSDEEIEALKSNLVVAVRGDGGRRGSSKLVLRHENQLQSWRSVELASVLPEAVELAGAEVAGSVCEPGVARCVESSGPESESYLFIDVAVSDGGEEISN